LRELDLGLGKRLKAQHVQRFQIHRFTFVRAARWMDEVSHELRGVCSTAKKRNQKKIQDVGGKRMNPY
jgi:hypothetical protein